MKVTKVEFGVMVLALDGGCMNPDCPCHSEESFEGLVLSAHHIIRRSQGGSDTSENGICFCAISHDWAEGRRNLKINGQRVTGRQFVIIVLDGLVGKPEYRWSKAHNELKRKEGV